VTPQVTVVFLLYNAEKSIPMLVEALAQQRHKDVPRQDMWLSAIFMDDGSRDHSAEVLDRCLSEKSRPVNWRSMRNGMNLGLAATLNKVLELVRTPWVLSCHCDCEFGTDTYVARMVDLITARDDAAAITGKPTMHPQRVLPFAERANLVANLMDILPPEKEGELLPVGFAEGRCDIFRVEALRAVGFYETTLRTAGEDQVLAARLRQKGYEIYRAPHLPYYLSVSGEQDSLRKLARHQRLFGRAHPYILLRTRQASAGVTGRHAGSNRRLRMLLRVQQLLAAGASFGMVAALLCGALWVAVALLGAVSFGKFILFRRHLRLVSFQGMERVRFAAVQPVLDFSYTLGLLQGLVRVLTSTPERPID
jgi:glycosyltransferase involved in cell wall biosynthesis